MVKRAPFSRRNAPLPFRPRRQRWPWAAIAIAFFLTFAVALFAVRGFMSGEPSANTQPVERPIAPLGATGPRYVDPRELREERPATEGGSSVAHFSLCHTGGGRNCVVDGDTIWLNGEKIRIADIDTPETHPARCADEQRLGDRATARLQNLLNAGPVELYPAANGRTHDRYGRRLAVLARDGQSLGMILVGEGLARRYSGGPRDPWC